ncbi:hypothetical protein VARIO8X_90150 [Burkholderiales bacterium 8X]|nr:hypothetical protein VARIO8X_90150 [Burkholderiales bacterium 8X]
MPQIIDPLTLFEGKFPHEETSDERPHF